MRRVDHYDEVSSELGDTSATLLLGNGFSMGAHRGFGYGALLDNARDSLPDTAQTLFTRLGTQNFESVLERLDDAVFLGIATGQVNAELATVARETRYEMAHAIARDHPSYREFRRVDTDAASAFLGRFDRVFTTNYDRLLYWLAFLAPRTVDGGYRWRDGFGRTEDDDSLRLTDPGAIEMGFLHGGFHLLVDEAGPTKLRRDNGRSLADQVDAIFAAGDEPLFVAAGTPKQKLRAIRDNAYLSAAFDAFTAASGPLVVYGHGLGPSDAHLLQALVEPGAFDPIYVGYYAPLDQASTLELRARLLRFERSHGLAEDRICLFPSPTAAVWGPPP